VLLPAGKVPIIYLPGLSRQGLRAADSIPDDIKPLAELQYRGAFWSQVKRRRRTRAASCGASEAPPHEAGTKLC